MLVDPVMEEVKGVIEERKRDEIHAEDEQTEVIRELRDLPPIHYLFKIKKFSVVSNAKSICYQSTDFEIGGYKWKLSFYPKGNKEVNETKHISLYLVLSESNSLPMNREVNVYLKLFVYNQIQDKYLAVQDAKGRVRRFRGMKTAWGFDQLLPLDVFSDASNGDLINDCCVFGAEVFVLEGSSKGECASGVKELDNNIYTWKVENFAELKEETYNSEEFVIGGHGWSLELHPIGHEKETGKSLSVYLDLEDDLDTGRSVYVEYVLRVKNQVQGNHHERFQGTHIRSPAAAADDDGDGDDVEYVLRVKNQVQGNHHERFQGTHIRSPAAAAAADDDDGDGDGDDGDDDDDADYDDDGEDDDKTAGFLKFMPLSKLKDPASGYLINGAIILEVEFSLVTKVKAFS